MAGESRPAATDQAIITYARVRGLAGLCSSRICESHTSRNIAAQKRRAANLTAR